MEWRCTGCSHSEPVGRNENPDRKVCPRCGSIMRAYR